MALFDQDQVRKAVELTGGNPHNIFADDSADQAAPDYTPDATATRAAVESTTQAEASKPQYPSLDEIRSQPSPEPIATQPRGPRARDGWEPTQLPPEEEARFQDDMRNGSGYKEWRDNWTKDYGEEPNYDDPEGDYDYRGAWKAGVRPSLYKYDQKYHWGSSTEDGRMLKAPDHPTAWMEYFMRATGKDPNEVGVKNEAEGKAWIAANAGKDAQPAAPRAKSPAGAGPEQQSAPPSEQDIEDRVFNRRDSTRSLQDQVQAGQNRALDLTEQTKGGIQAEGQAKAAEQLGQLRELQKQGREDISNRVNLNRQQKQEFEDRMVSKVDELSDKMRNPPKDTVGMVMGVIAAAMGAAGNHKGAVMTHALGQAFNTKMQKWQAGVQADDMELKHLRGLFDMQNEDSMSELHQEAEMSKLAVAEFDSALKQVAAETGSKEAKATAEAARLQLRQQYVTHQLDIRARAVQAERARNIYQTLGRAPTPEARAALAHQIGPDGDKVLQDMNKTEKGQADINLTAASAEKARQSGQAELLAAQNKASGARALTEGQQKLANIVGGAKAAYQRLNSLVAGGGEANRGATKETWVPDLLRSEDTLQQRADIKALALSVLRAESGSNIPDHEIQAKYEALPVASGDPEVRKRGLIDLLNAYRSLDNTGQLSAGSNIAFTPDSTK